jgi:hypothetical protein
MREREAFVSGKTDTPSLLLLRIDSSTPYIASRFLSFWFVGLYQYICFSLKSVETNRLYRFQTFVLTVQVLLLRSVNMVAVDIPSIQYTPVDEIPQHVEKVRTTFFLHKTRPIEFRLQQLRKLYWA